MTGNEKQYAGESGWQGREAERIPTRAQPSDSPTSTPTGSPPGVPVAVISGHKWGDESAREHGQGPGNTFVVAGIECSGKAGSYIHSYALYGDHGRGLAVGIGTELANPNLNLMVADSDGYSVGAGRFIHAVRRDVDLSCVVMDNRSYDLTKVQASPTSRENVGPQRRPRVRNNHPSPHSRSCWLPAGRSSPSRSRRTHSATPRSSSRRSNTTVHRSPAVPTGVVSSRRGLTHLLVSVRAGIDYHLGEHGENDFTNNPKRSR